MTTTLIPGCPTLTGWNHKDIWLRHGNGFCIEVSRHSVERSMIGQGIHRWCVYAYIYPTHPRYKRFDDSGFWQDAATELPLHAGATLLRFHASNTGERDSVQVGADYNHLGDDHFTHYATANDAMSVFLDAADLAAFLEAEAAAQVENTTPEVDHD
jgi:hypothetical protein